MGIHWRAICKTIGCLSISPRPPSKAALTKVVFAGNANSIRTVYMTEDVEFRPYEQRPDWPKMGPSLLISTCLILAIRTAKWPAVFNKSTSHPELDREIDFAANLASSVGVDGKAGGLLPSAS